MEIQLFDAEGGLKTPVQVIEERLSYLQGQHEEACRKWTEAREDASRSNIRNITAAENHWQETQTALGEEIHKVSALLCAEREREQASRSEHEFSFVSPVVPGDTIWLIQEKMSPSRPTDEKCPACGGSGVLTGQDGQGWPCKAVYLATKVREAAWSCHQGRKTLHSVFRWMIRSATVFRIEHRVEQQGEALWRDLVIHAHPEFWGSSSQLAVQLHEYDYYLTRQEAELEANARNEKKP